MSIAQEPFFVWLAQFAFQPGMVYSLIVAMMFLSAVGLPFPEELTLVSAGLLAFMGANPQHFPPPYPGAPVVNPIEAAIVATVAVFAADFLIYIIGRVWGRKLVYHPKMSRFFSKTLLDKAEDFTRRYGMLATGIFRFTPGVRFPGHLFCGMMRLAPWKFALVDAIAVSISVPTQVLLLAYYGEPILHTLKQFKIVVFAIIGIVLVAFLAIKVRNWARARNQARRAKIAAETNALSRSSSDPSV